MSEEKKPWAFCETPEEKCTMNYCDENGCQNRKRNLVEDKIVPVFSHSIDSKRSGKMNDILLLMVPKLIAGYKVGVAGSKDPIDIIQRFKTLGIEVNYKPMYSHEGVSIFEFFNDNEAEKLSFISYKEEQIGSVFYLCEPQKQDPLEFDEIVIEQCPNCGSGKTGFAIDMFECFDCDHKWNEE